MDKVLARNKKWVQANREKCRAATLRWQKKNRDKCNALYAARYAAKLRAVPSWSNTFFVEEAYRLAQIRTKVTGIKWAVDHIVPLKSKLVCGLHAHTNIAVIPALANSLKSNIKWPDMP